MKCGKNQVWKLKGVQFFLYTIGIYKFSIDGAICMLNDLNVKAIFGTCDVCNII